jgi:hypothetical protein
MLCSPFGAGGGDFFKGNIFLNKKSEKTRGGLFTMGYSKRPAGSSSEEHLTFRAGSYRTSREVAY